VTDAGDDLNQARDALLERQERIGGAGSV